MADIFISYAHEDQARIKDLVEVLEKQGWSIFWDRRIPIGKTWQSYIGQALSDAKCVIVAWSHHSIISDWVVEEANDGKKRGLLIPILLDAVEPPLGFRGIQAADLADWKPGSSSSSFDQLIQEIAALVGGKPHRPTPDGNQRSVEDISPPTSTSQSVTGGPPTSERVVYSGSGRDLGFDFRGSEAQRWVNVGGKSEPVGEHGRGVLTFDIGLLTLQRSNTDGRYELLLRTYIFNGMEMTTIPKDNLNPGRRRLRISCEAKVIGAEHTLHFVLKNEETNKWVANEERTISSNVWTPIKIYFDIPRNEECRLRIDDLKVTHAPSSVQIRKFLLVERGS